MITKSLLEKLLGCFSNRTLANYIQFNANNIHALRHSHASQSIANYTSNQHTAVYHREVNEKKCNRNAIL